MQDRVTEKPKKLVTVICACIRREGGKEVLLSLRRAPGIAGLDGKWELPGGKIEFGETPEQAIVREIQEEIGIRIVPIRLLPYLHTNLWHYEHMDQHVILACLDCETSGDPIERLGDDVRWFPIGAIDFSSTLPGTREFVSLAAHSEAFEGLYLRFEYVDSRMNSSKQFSLVSQPTLFSNYGLAIYWGRIGQLSRLKIEEFRSARDLDMRLLGITKRRLAHGYRLVELSGPSKRYEALQQVISMARSRGAISQDVFD